MNFFLQRDKQLHIATCAAWTVFFYALLSQIIPFDAALPWAINQTFSVGLAKELYDRAHPEAHTADVMDILADVIGSYVGVVAILLWRHFL